MFDFFRNLDKRKLIGLGIFLILLIALPLIIIQVQKQQQSKQRAEGSNNVYLELKSFGQGPNTISNKFVQTLYLHNPVNKNISAIDITLVYNKDIVGLVAFDTEGIFSDVVKDAAIPGTLHYVAVNTKQVPIADSVIPIGALTLTGKAIGSGTIDFNNIVVTASDDPQPLVVNVVDNRLGSYTIEQESISATPTIFISETLTPLPTFQPTESISQVSSFTPTPTTGSFPYSYSIFPKEGPIGTIFTIKLKTLPNLKLLGTFKYPNPSTSQGTSTFTVELKDTGEDSDGLHTYSYVLDSSSGRLGAYSVTFYSFFGSDNERLIHNYDAKVSFTVVQDPARNTCVPVTQNGDSTGKIDIVVMSDHYKKNELNNFQKSVLSEQINAIFAKDPFSLNKDKFNVWFVKKSSDIDCDFGSNDKCIQHFQDIAYANCPFFDKIIVIDKKDYRQYADLGSIDVAFALGTSKDPRVIIHEFGHAMGKLADEYNMSHDPRNPANLANQNSYFIATRPKDFVFDDDYSSPYYRGDRSDANCDAFACPKWCSGTSNLENPKCSTFKDKKVCESNKYNGISCIWLSDLKECDYPYDEKGKLNFGQSCQENTACYYGCGWGRNEYRSSANSIMNNYYASDGKEEFNDISKKQIQKEIDRYTK